MLHDTDSLKYAHNLMHISSSSITVPAYVNSKARLHELCEMLM